MDAMRKVGVIGHRNPDTDSICSAIAYADLKNKIGEMNCEPLRAGAVNGETEYVLRRFGVSAPELCPDVSAQVKDIDIRPMPGTDGMTTVRKAWETMRDQQISTLPITDSAGNLMGIITLKDLAMANMDISSTNFLSVSPHPLPQYHRNAGRHTDHRRPRRLRHLRQGGSRRRQPGDHGGDSGAGRSGTGGQSI